MQRTSCFVALTCLAITARAAAQEEQSVFRQPLVMPVYAQLQARATAALREKEYAKAQELCEESIRLAPHYPGAHYNRACALALQGKKDDAFAALRKSID